MIVFAHFMLFFLKVNFYFLNTIFFYSPPVSASCATSVFIVMHVWDPIPVDTIQYTRTNNVIITTNEEFKGRPEMVVNSNNHYPADASWTVSQAFFPTVVVHIGDVLYFDYLGVDGCATRYKDVTAIPYILKDEDVNIYPNPAISSFRVNLPNGDYQIEIYNML